MGDLNRHLDKLMLLQKRWQEAKSFVWGISTGFPTIDKLTGGLHDGEVFIIAARTSHGKTALANQIAFSIAEEIALESEEAGEPTGQVVMFSPEMSPEMLLLRQTCVMSSVPSEAIRTGSASELELQMWMEAVSYLRDLDPYLTIKAGADLSVQEVSTVVESRKNAGPPVRLVVIDYLQYLTSGIGGNGNAYNSASAVSKEIRVMANQEQVPVLLMAQLNRSVEKRANSEDPDDALPQLWDLRDSGKIEEHADTIGLLHRPNKITDDQTEPQKAIFAIRKNRNGPVGVLNLFYYPHLTRFRDPLDHQQIVTV